MCSKSTYFNLKREVSATIIWVIEYWYNSYEELFDIRYLILIVSDVWWQYWTLDSGTQIPEKYDI